MAEMAETACSDTAYLGYEYPAFAGHSFADTLANHRPKDPVSLDAPTAHEVSLAAINESNHANDDRDSSSDCDDIGGCVNGSINGTTDGDSDVQGHPNANDNSPDTSHNLNNDDDIEIDNV